MYIEHKNILLAHERSSKYKDKYKYCILKSAFSDPLWWKEPLEYTNETKLTNKAYKDTLLLCLEGFAYHIFNDLNIHIVRAEKIKNMLYHHTMRFNMQITNVFSPYFQSVKTRLNDKE